MFAKWVGLSAEVGLAEGNTSELKDHWHTEQENFSQYRHPVYYLVVSPFVELWLTFTESLLHARHGIQCFEYISLSLLGTQNRVRGSWLNLAPGPLYWPFSSHTSLLPDHCVWSFPSHMVHCPSSLFPNPLSSYLFAALPSLTLIHKSSTVLYFPMVFFITFCSFWNGLTHYSAHASSMPILASWEKVLFIVIAVPLTRNQAGLWQRLHKFFFPVSEKAYGRGIIILIVCMTRPRFMEIRELIRVIWLLRLAFKILQESIKLQEVVDETKLEIFQVSLKVGDQICGNLLFCSLYGYMFISKIHLMKASKL